MIKTSQCIAITWDDIDAIKTMDTVVETSGFPWIVKKTDVEKVYIATTECTWESLSTPGGGCEIKKVEFIKHAV